MSPDDEDEGNEGMNSVQQLVRSKGNTWAEEGIIADSIGQEDPNEEDPIEEEATMIDASDSDDEGKEMGQQNVANPSTSHVQKDRKSTRLNSSH